MKRLLIPAGLGLAMGLFFWEPVDGHPGAKDSKGCHADRETGDIHCHQAVNDVDDPDIVKKSRAGICHDRTSPNYYQLKYYVTYPTMQACLESGGRQRR
jgi:hypothetical protein